MQVRPSLRAWGNSHPGLVRDANEDRYHCDASAGVFLVIDGVGGHAAGETAAETALTSLRQALEAGAGPVEARLRSAIASANNEIYRLASGRPVWQGMACVLTVVVLDGLEAVVGHVGDTRLYKIRGGRIEKLTRDHSPVGEREDAGDLGEAEAMRHPRRSEVYRDVGSERRRAEDPEFIDVFRAPFEPDAALLLCSDGLTDQVDSATIRNTVEEYAGQPSEVVAALIDAAILAGGKDNVTVVYAEGSRFAVGEDTGAVRGGRPQAAAVRSTTPGPTSKSPKPDRRRVALLVVLLTVVAAWAAYHQSDGLLRADPTAVPLLERVRIVLPGQSIGEAIAAARPGTEIVVEPGEYRERLRLATGVRVRSRVPRGASLRLPGAASEMDAAVVAESISDAEIVGFRIIGDAATPLGTGVLVRQSAVTLTDIEITGASVAGIVFDAGATGALLASTLHDNPGAAILVRAGAEPRVAHNAFARNATTGRSAATILIEAGAVPQLSGNVFVGATPKTVIGLVGPAASALAADNWFVPAPRETRPSGRGTGGRP